MKKILLIIFTVVLFGLLIGCSEDGSANNNDTSSNDENNSEEITLKFFHRYTKDPANTYLKEVVKSFEKENPNINIKMDAAANDEYKKKIRVVLGSNETPDIYFAWSGYFAKNFAKSDKALNISPYMEKDKEWKKRMVGSQLKPFKYKDDLYGIPLYMDEKVFYYNKEIFNELNIESPQNWEDFLDALQTLKDSGVVPIALGNKSPWAIGHYLTTVNKQMVSPETIKNDYNGGDNAFQADGYIDAVKKLQQLEPFFSEDPNAVTHDFAKQLFTSGKAAMISMQISELQYLKKTDFNIGFLQFPDEKGSKGVSNFIAGAPQGFMISKETEHPDAATKFLKFLTSEKIAEKLVRDTGYMSAVKGAINSDTASPEIVESSKRIMSAEDTAVWIDTAFEVKIANTYMKETSLMLGGDSTPKEVMEAVQESAKSVRDNN